MSKLISRIAVTITSGQAVSTAAVLDGKTPTILEMPADWTMAAIYFNGSGNGTTWYGIYDTAGVLVACAAASQHRINLPSQYLSDHLSLQVCSGTPVSLVNQGADRTLYLEIWE